MDARPVGPVPPARQGPDAAMSLLLSAAGGRNLLWLCRAGDRDKLKNSYCQNGQLTWQDRAGKPWRQRTL